jgi:hypothetical protein
MDDEQSAHNRETLFDLFRQQRPPSDTEDRRRQMLATTLRLAGHTVSQKSNVPAGTEATGQVDNAAQVDDAEQVDDSAQADDTAQSDGRVQAEGTAVPADPAEIGAPSQPLDVASGEPAQSDYPRQAESPLLHYDVAWVDDSAQAGGADGALDRGPVRAHEPYIAGQPGTAVGDPAQPGVWNSNPTFSSGGSLGASVAAGISGSIPFCSTSTGRPPVAPATLDVDSIYFHRPPASGSTPFFPTPGAGALFNRPTESGANDAGDDGFFRPDDAGMSGDDQAPARRSTIIVQPTAILTERLTTAAAEKVLPLAQNAADTAIGGLRNEIYVSRAALNALFPR